MSSSRTAAADPFPARIPFFEGDRSREVYLCVSGQIRIFMSLSSGRELVLGSEGAG